MARRVLVVDDHHAALGYALAVLRHAGFEVEGAINIAEVVACLERGHPDALLVDVQMPELDGDQLVRFLRDVYKVRAPIVLLSVMEEPELAELARRSGADGYVRKGSAIAALPAAIEAAIARRA